MQVRFDTNDYCVPVKYAGHNVGIKGYAKKVEIYSDGMMIASHERCFEKHQSIYKLEHYLPLLEQCGRAILNAVPVRQNIPQDVLEKLKNNSPRELMRISNGYCNNYEPTTTEQTGYRYSL